MDELRTKLAEMEGPTCTPLRLQLRVAGAGGARLVAIASDGRSAERPVRPETLVATGLGLVMGVPAEGEGEGVEGGAAGAGLRPGLRLRLRLR